MGPTKVLMKVPGTQKVGKKQQPIYLDLSDPVQQYEYAMKMLRKRKKKIFAFEGPYADGNQDERAELMQMFQNINRNN